MRLSRRSWADTEAQYTFGILFFGTCLRYDAGMKFNFIGVAQPLVAIEGTAKTWTQAIYEDGTAADLAGLVFTLLLTSPAGETREATLEVGPAGILWRLPAMDAGEWRYELWVADAFGTRARMFYGPLEVLPTTLLRRAETTPCEPVMKTFLSSADGSMRWDWLDGNAAHYYAQQAQASAQEAQRVEAEVLDAVRAIPELRQFIIDFRTEVASAIYIDANGMWVVGDTVTGTPAQGPRGMNADEVQYHVISSVKELPTDAEHCTPYHRYVIQGSPGVAATAWIEFVRPAAGSTEFIWLRINGFAVVVEASGADPQVWADAINANPELYGVVATMDYSLPNRAIMRLRARREGNVGNFITLYAKDEHGMPYQPTSGETLEGGEDAVYTEQYLWIEGAWTSFPMNAPTAATSKAHGLALLSTDNVVQHGLPVGNNERGQLVTDATNLPLPRATKTVEGIMRRAAAVVVGDEGATSGSQVADALRGKQDALDFKDPESPVMLAIRQAAIEAVAEAGAVSVEVGDVKINFSPEVPPGFLPMEGQRGLSRSRYAALFNYFEKNKVELGDGTLIADSGDGATTFDMPDLSGCFMRFIGSGRKLDEGRAPGSFQPAAAPNIKGSITGAYYGYGQWKCKGSFSSPGFSGWATRGGGGGDPKNIDLAFDASVSSPVYKDGVGEVRPPNIALYAYIKY